MEDEKRDLEYPRRVVRFFVVRAGRFGVELCMKRRLRRDRNRDRKPAKPKEPRSDVPGQSLEKRSLKPKRDDTRKRFRTPIEACPNQLGSPPADIRASNLMERRVLELRF